MKKERPVSSCGNLVCFADWLVMVIEEERKPKENA